MADSSAARLVQIAETLTLPQESGSKRNVTVHYRHAALVGASDDSRTLQQRLHDVMQTDFAKDVSKRLFKITSADEGPQGCLNLHQSTPLLAFMGDIMHFDRRTSSLRFIHPNSPTPTAKIEHLPIGDNASSLSEPVYFMVRGNHLAVIERPGFRLVHLTRYLNRLLASAHQLEPGEAFQLSAKFQYTSTSPVRGPVKRIVLKPHGAFEGYGATQAPEPKRRSPVREALIEGILANGDKVRDIMRAAGASEARIEALRQNMSSDLAIQVKVEFSVVSLRKKTSAELAPQIVQLALADLTAEGEVEVCAADGKTQGELASLSSKTVVLEVDGLLDWTSATTALAHSLFAWVDKGVIDFE